MKENAVGRQPISAGEDRAQLFVRRDGHTVLSGGRLRFYPHFGDSFPFNSHHAGGAGGDGSLVAASNAFFPISSAAARQSSGGGAVGFG
jgi:hypothetical protein